MGLTLLMLVAGASSAAEPVRPDLAEFAAELRAAIASADPVALAPLVSFPLRINYPDGSATSLVNPRALQVHFDLVFSPEVRKAIVEPDPEGFIHRSSGIGIGNGVVWAELVGSGEGERYRIFAVNLPGSRPRSREPELVFVCDAAAHRVVVDTVADALRYRSWNRPKSLTEKPDLEIVGGIATMSGTTPCTASTWTFARGETQYAIEEVGCGEGGDDGSAIAELIVTSSDRQIASWWCY